MTVQPKSSDIGSMRKAVRFLVLWLPGLSLWSEHGHSLHSLPVARALPGFWEGFPSQPSFSIGLFKLDNIKEQICSLNLGSQILDFKFKEKFVPYSPILAYSRICSLYIYSNIQKHYIVTISIYDVQS